MIHSFLTFIKDDLNVFFRQKLFIDEDTVEFIDGENNDPLEFKLGKITPLIVNLREERILRSADRFLHLQENGAKEASVPIIPIHVYLLFVSRFKDYLEGMKRLTLLLQYFQTHPTFTPQLSPGLEGEDIRKVNTELYSLSFQEQNELWASLKMAYHPSLLYKFSILILQDSTPTLNPEVGSLSQNLNQL